MIAAINSRTSLALDERHFNIVRGVGTFKRDPIECSDCRRRLNAKKNDKRASLCVFV
jgi:hypothetical protein